MSHACRGWLGFAATSPLLVGFVLRFRVLSTAGSMPTCPPSPSPSLPFPSTCPLADTMHRRHQHRRAHQVKVVETAEAAGKEAEAEHARLQKEYKDMCAGVATEKEGSRTLTDQVGGELHKLTYSREHDYDAASFR